MTATYDVIIKNGRIIDGSGNPWFQADIGIVGGAIAAVFRTGGGMEGKRVIDAAGKVVSPGFIDTHSHDDAYVLIDPQCSQKVLQGVTTDVIGNCGFSLAPLSDARCNDFRTASALMGGNQLGDDFWSLRAFAQYLARLDSAKLGINVLPLVGHGTIRIAVIGYENRDPSESEMVQMKQMTAEAMQAGAFGLSTGLIYVPANYAHTEEVIQLARVAAKHGGIYTTHMRSESNYEMEAIEETLKIARASGIAVHISHHKIAGQKNWGNSRLTLKTFADARTEGLTVTWDQYPYRAGSTFLPAALPPHVQAQGTRQVAEKLADPAVRRQIRQEIESSEDHSWENLIRGAGFENIIISASPRNPDFVGKSIAAIAEMTGKDPFEVYFDLVAEEQMEAGMVIFMMDDEDIERILRHPGTMIGSDGIPSFGTAKPHPRMTGTFPRVLGRYAREKGVITLEEAIRKMTSLPAQTFGLYKKGLVRPGMDADLVVFDPDTIIDKSTFEDPLQPPEGIHWVIVNGEVAAEDGKIAGATSGKVLRRGRN
ncbi:MAG: D-aminoacylase [Desulfobacterales bacterium]|nr:MAG: D-aminoacylase [Desulfobacterales bacterium]